MDRGGIGLAPNRYVPSTGQHRAIGCNLPREHFKKYVAGIRRVSSHLGHGTIR